MAADKDRRGWHPAERMGRMDIALGAARSVRTGRAALQVDTGPANVAPAASEHQVDTGPAAAVDKKPAAAATPAAEQAADAAAFDEAVAEHPAPVQG